MSTAPELPVTADALRQNRWGNPIFITGFARSGTTWVNQILRDYCDVGLVNEGNFIVHYGQRLRSYGDLLPPKIYEKLVRRLPRDAFFAILRRNYSIEIQWQRVRAAGPRFSACVLEILTQISDGMGNSRIGSKYPGFGWDLSLLTELFPRCSIVHVIRDGRDCALSHKAMTWGYQNTYTAACHWRKYLQDVRKSVERGECRYHEVRYEDLITQPEETLRSLARFVGGASEADVLPRFRAEAEKWRRPEDAVARWCRAMSLRDQFVFETIAGDMLAESGYAARGLRKPIPAVSKAAFIVQDQCMREFWRWSRKMIKSLPEQKVRRKRTPRTTARRPVER